METQTLYTRISKTTGKSEFRTAMHRRGKFGWRPIAVRWVECLYDICGNERNPGACADLWEEVGTGRKLITLQGAWQMWVPQTRPATRIPATFFADEFPPVDFDSGEVSAWMAQQFSGGAPARVQTGFHFVRRPSSPIRIDGVPFVGHGNSLSFYDHKDAQKAGHAAHLKAYADGAQTLDGTWTYETLTCHRFDSDIHYLVRRDGQAWFTTGSYGLVLRSLAAHLANRATRLAIAA